MEKTSKNRKKMYGAALAVTITSAVLATVLIPALVMPRGGYSNVAFVPNTNNVYDKSFNEETNKGITKYQATFGEDVSSYIPSSYLPSNSEFYEIYGSAITSGGANVVMGNSFTQAAPMTGFCSNGAWEYSNESACKNGGYVWTDGLAVVYPEVDFILLDDSGMKNYENGLSVNFAAMDAGFMAGVMAAMYATAVQNPGTDGQISTSDDQAPVVGTWGGAAYNTVYDWMSGYEQAINWWNHAILGYDVAGNMNGNSGVSGSTFVTVDSLAELTPSGGGSTYQNNTLGLHTKGYDYVQLTQGSQWTSKEDTYKNLDATGAYSTGGYIVSDAGFWYMGNFEIGTASDTRANNIEDAGASVVFPVAGGQFISAFTQTDMQVIGVDTDIVPTYEEQYGDQILGSATKNLAFGAESSLWVTDRYVYTFDSTYQGFDDSIRGNDVPYNEEWTLADEKMYWMTVGQQEQLYKTTAADGTTENYLNSTVDIYSSDDDTTKDTTVYTWDATTYTYEVVADDPDTGDIDESEQTGWVSGNAGKWYQGTSVNGGTGWASGQGSETAWTKFSAILTTNAITFTGITSEIDFINKIALEANSVLVDSIYVPRVEYQSPTFTHGEVDGTTWLYGWNGTTGFKWIPN